MRLTLIIIFFPIFATGQSFDHSVFLGPNYGQYNSPNAKVFNTTFKWGGEVGYKLEYRVSKSFKIGLGAEYEMNRSMFYTDCNCYYHIGTLSTEGEIQYLLTTYSVNTPIYLKLSTSQDDQPGLSFQLGAGLSLITYARKRIKRGLMYRKSWEGYTIRTTGFSLRSTHQHRLGTFFQAGIGQQFRLWEKMFYTNLMFRTDMNFWRYQAEAIDQKPAESYLLKRQRIMLKLGTFLDN